MSSFENRDPSATSRFDAISPRGESGVVGRGLDAEDLATINALPASSALLIALKGANLGARFLLNADAVTVGRHPKSDIFLDDGTVSRKHATFLRSGSTFYVRDERSLNGTYVNMELVEEAQLKNGDEVRIGKYQLTFYASPRSV
ncbi:MAG: FHA domain-containing protein [Actinomycetaceae bacterium]|nr:FHA domain-containing protein [Actinomycetaceae bacterium]